MKQILTFVLLAVFVNGYSQTGQNVKTDVNSEKFPEISIRWNDYTPEVRNKSVFSITDNGTERIFEMARSQETKNKSVLFLWEDMNANGLEPYNFTRKTLLEFFRETILQNGDRFGISVFSRERNHEDLLQPLVSDFTDDKNLLVNAVENYRHNTAIVNEQPKYSDLYKAIFKGIDLLNAEPTDNIKVIVVFTVGWNLTGGGAKSDASELTNKAKENHIPVYVALYPVHSTGVEIVTIAEDTYGKTIEYADAKNQLANFYTSLNRQHSPNEYRFTFKTDTEKDGKLHNIVLSVNGKQQAHYSFSAPAFSLVDWAKKNIWLVAGTGAAIIAVIVLIIILTVRNRRKIKEKLNRVQNEANTKAEETRKEAELIKEQQISWQQRQERKKREEEERSEQEGLAKLMRVKNMYPRLQCSVAGNKFVYTAGQPITAIGRTGENDLVLPHPTVSGKHAKIVFNGSCFEIVDLGSTNKVIVNGQFVTHAALKSGDIIGLGEAVITFYL
ncbi:MAG: FHA domain-containing protein [Prevotellaceae bacterium]|jgi:hypothetical protein|nr:FHA domain-containing protein [Prevotellaceae bacterium]